MNIKHSNNKYFNALTLSFQVDCNKYIDIQRNISYDLTKSGAYSKYFFELLFPKVVEESMADVNQSVTENKAEEIKYEPTNKKYKFYVRDG